MQSIIKKLLAGTLSHRLHRGLRLFAIASLIYAGLGFFAIPLLLEKIVIRQLTSETGVHIGIQNVTFNPFLFTLGIRGLEVGLDNQPAVIKASEIEVDLAVLKSIVGFRPSFDGIRLSDPDIGLHSMKDGTNLDEILGRLTSAESTPKEPSDAEIPAFAISNLSIEHGRFAYSAPEKRVDLDLGDINIALHDIDTASDRDGHFNVTVALSDGSLLSLKGGLQILPGEYRISADMSGLDLGWIQTTFPAIYPSAAIKGIVDVSTIVHLPRDDEGRMVVENLHLSLKEARLATMAKGLASLDLGRFELSGATIDAASHEVKLDTVDISDLGIISVPDSNGRPGWQSLLPPPASTAGNKKDAEQNASLWRFSLHQFHLKNLTFGSEAFSEENPGLRVGGFDINEITADSARRAVGIGSVHLADSRLLIRQDNQDIAPFKGFIPPVEPSVKDNINKSDQTEKMWVVRMEGFDTDDLAIRYEGGGKASALPIEFDQIKAHVGAVQSDEALSTPLSFSANLTSGGQVSLEGNINVVEKTAQGDLVLDKVDLAPVAPFLESYVLIDKTAGLISSHLALNAVSKNEQPKVQLKGGIEIERFEVTQAPDHRKLLFWEALALEGIEGSVLPAHITVKEMRLKKPGAVLDIREDKSSNIGDLKVPANEDNVASASSAKPPVSSGDSPEFQIHRISVDGAELDYSDQSLILPFATKIVELKGAITGLTLNPKGNAAIELHGRIAPYGEAEITGQLRPRDPTSSMDIALHMENVVLSSLSPYSATFAGRRIEGGKLDLNTQYRMENHQITSQNKILIKKLRLGDKVESPKAVSLPLDLAVSLLSDAEGNISLALPIEGSTDSPEFSFGRIVLDAFKTVLQKIVLSPFTAMASAMGLESDDLDAIAFDLGETSLTPPEKEKAARLVEALKRKPELRLKLSGVYDPEGDLPVLRSLWLRKVVAESLGEHLKDGEVPPPVNATDPSTQYSLDDLAMSSSVMDETLKMYVAESGHPPDRVGRLTKMFGKASKTPIFYEKLLQKLEDQAPIGALDLKHLAQQRAETVRSAVLEAGSGLSKNRISFGDVQTTRSEDGHHIRMPLIVEMD